MALQQIFKTETEVYFLELFKVERYLTLSESNETVFSNFKIEDTLFFKLLKNHISQILPIVVTL